MKAPAPAPEPQTQLAETPKLRSVIAPRAGARTARCAPVNRLDRSFAELPNGPHIEDEDAARAAVTRALVMHLASRLGLDASTLRIEVTRATGALNVRAESRPEAVWLDAAHFAPETIEGRRVLAHELVHVAQRGDDAAVLSGPLPQAFAEVEARALADTFARTAVIEQPQHVLAPQAVAAEAGLEQAEQAFENGFAALAETVKASRAFEIERMLDLLSYGVFDWAVTDTDVNDVLTILAMESLPVARAMARALGTKFRRRLIDNLNTGKHYSAFRAQILAVGWAATDPGQEWEGLEHKLILPMTLHDLTQVEAVAANFIVRSMSPAGRDTLLKHDTQGPRVRELEAAAKGARLSEALGLALADAQKAEAAAKAAREAAPDPTQADLVKDIKRTLDKVKVWDADAIRLLHRIRAECVVGRDPAQAFRTLANALGPRTVDALIDQIPLGPLLKSSALRRAYVLLLNTRPPLKNLDRIDELLDTSFFLLDWSVNSDEAYEAYLLVKAMPPQAQLALFRSRGGARWSDILGNLTEDMRQDATTNLYHGGEQQKDRQSMLMQLLDKQLWSEAQIGKLRGLIRMARAAGEAAFVFEQSRVHDAANTPGLSGLVGEFNLYDAAAGRTSFKDDALESEAWDWGNLGVIMQALDFIVSSENVDVDTNAVGGKGLDLGEFQDVTGGDFMGAEFERLSSRERKAGKRAARDARKAIRKDDPVKLKQAQDARKLIKNWADVRWNPERGALTLKASLFKIKRISYPLDNMRITSGPAELHDIDVSMNYMPKQHLLRSLTLNIGSFDVRDLGVLFGDSMLDIGHMHIDNLHVVFEAADKKHKDSFTPGAEGMGHAIGNIWDIVMGSATSDLSSSFTNPGWAMELIVTFDGLTLESVTTSGGSFVQKVQLDKFAMHSGGDAQSYRRALAGSLSRVQARLAQAQSARDAATDSKASAAQDKVIARLKKQIKGIEAELSSGKKGGSILDVGSVSITGMEGVNGSDNPITLADMHGHGRSVDGVLPLLTSSRTTRNLITGEAGISTINDAESGEQGFMLDVGSIEASNLRLPGGIPTPEAASSDYLKFIKNPLASRSTRGYQEISALLQTRAKQAGEYAALTARSVLDLSSAEARRMMTLRRALLAFEERRAMTIARVQVDGATLTLGSKGEPGITADALLVQTITLRNADGSEQGVIGKIEADNVKLGTSVSGGVTALANWRSTLRSANAQADSLRISDVAFYDNSAGDPAQRKTFGFDSLVFDKTGAAAGEPGFAASLDRDKGSASLQTASVVATGITLPTYALLLRAERERITAVPVPDQTADEARRVQTIDAMLVDLDQIKARQDKAQAVLAAKPSAKARDKASRQLASSQQDYQHWQQRLVVEKLSIAHLDLRFAGLGDPLADGYDFDAATAGSLSITGGGADKRLFSSLTIEGAKQRGAMGDQLIAQKVEIGATHGEIKRTAKGWALAGFQVDSVVAAAGIHYSTPAGMRIFTTGETMLSGISLDLDYVSGDSGSVLTITQAKINSASARGLHYEDAEKTIVVREGELGGIVLDKFVVEVPPAADPRQPKPEGKDAPKTKISGGLSVERVQGLAVNALVAGYNVDAVVNSSAPPAGKQVNALSVQFARSGDVGVTVNGLTASASVTQPGSDNRVRVMFKEMSGEVLISGDTYTVKGLKLGTIKLSNGHWTLGDTTIDINGAVTLDGVSVDARAKTRKKTLPARAGQPAGEKLELAELYFTKVEVGTGHAEDVSVVMAKRDADPAKGVDARERMEFLLGDATIHGLLITGFDALATEGKVEITKDVQINNLTAIIGEEGKETFKRGKLDVKASGRLGPAGRELSVDLRGKDGMRIKLGRVDELTLTDVAQGKTKPGSGGLVATDGIDFVSASVKGVTTDDLLVTDDKISIGSISIDSAVLGNLHWVDAKSGAVLTLNAVRTEEQPLTINSMVASFKKVPKPGGKTARELEEIKIGGVSLPKARAFSLTYTGKLVDPPNPTQDITLKLPETIVHGLAITEFSKNYSTQLTKLDAAIKKTEIDDFSLTLTKRLADGDYTTKLVADVEADALRAEAILKTTDPGTKDEKTALDSGYFSLDKLGLRRITTTFIQPGQRDAKFGDSGSKFKAGLAPDEPGVDLGGLRYDTSGTTIGSASGRGLVYTDPNLGLTLDIKRAQLSAPFTIPPNGKFTLPGATIDEAYFRIDDLSALPANKNAKPGGKSGDLIKNMDILDKVNGKIKLKVYTGPIYLFDMPDVPFTDWDIPLVGGKRYLRQDEFPLDLEVKDGKVNYEVIEDQATWRRYDAVAGLNMDGNMIALEVGPTFYNILEWTLDQPGEVDDAKKELMRLKRLALPDSFRADVVKWHNATPDERKEIEKKAEEDAAKQKASGIPDHISPMDIELRDVDADVNIVGQTPFDLGSTGSIKIGGTSPTDKIHLTAKTDASSKTRLNWALENLKVQVETLNLDSGARVSGAEIEVGAVKDAQLNFHDNKVMKPGKLEGTITNASVRNLTFTPAEVVKEEAAKTP